MIIPEQPNCELEYWRKNIMPRTSYIDFGNKLSVSKDDIRPNCKKEDVRSRVD